jgi:hypothetical protein
LGWRGIAVNVMNTAWQGAQSPTKGTLLGIALVGLALYAGMICSFVSASATGSDESGYFNHARLLASGSLHARPRELPGLPMAQTPYYLYVPLGMKQAANGNSLVPTYPAGFPLLILAAKPFAGWEHAADVILVMHSIAGLLLTWALGRAMGLSPPWALVAAAIIAASPLYIFFSLRAMSDLPAMVWTTAAVLSAWRARERGSWALLAGFTLSVAVLVRPTDAIAALPVALAVARGPISLLSVARRWGLVMLGGLPGAVFYCLHSRFAYGHALTTGYGDIGADFGRMWIGASLFLYAQWLPVLLTPVVLFVLALPWMARTAPGATAVLGVWILAYAAFYSTYRFTHEAWWYLRFLLPIAPALVVGGLLGMRLVLGGIRGRLTHRRAFAVALAAVGLAGAFWTYRLYVFKDIRTEKVYLRSAKWILANVPRDAIILSMQTSGALYFDTDYTLLRWDSLDGGTAPAVFKAIKASKRPLYAALFPFENGPALRQMPGNWTRLKTMGAVTVWRRDDK